MKKGQVEIDQTVIHKTLRTEDLVEAFTDEYERLGGLESNVTLFRSHLQMEDVNSERRHRDPHLLTVRQENLIYDLEDLFGLLGGMAPEGTSFGSHAGDASDFGFWTDDGEYDDEPIDYTEQDRDAAASERISNIQNEY